MIERNDATQLPAQGLWERLASTSHLLLVHISVPQTSLSKYIDRINIVYGVLREL